MRIRFLQRVGIVSEDDMAFFPDVTRGQTFTPNALLSNNVRRMVNSLNGFQAGGQRGGHSGTVRIQVYNNSESEIAEGTAVNFSDSGFFCENAAPCETLKDAGKAWGVLLQTLAPMQIGDCIISGPAVVSVTGSGEYASPSVSSPGIFERGSSGAVILFSSEDGKAVINLGAAVMAPSMFTVSLKTSDDGESVTADVTGGMIFFNRLCISDCPEKKSIPVQAGFFCIKAEQTGERSVDVDYEIRESADDFPVMESESDSPVVYYPVAKITQSDDGGSWTVQQIVRYQIPHHWAFGPCTTEAEQI